MMTIGPVSEVREGIQLYYSTCIEDARYGEDQQPIPSSSAGSPHFEHDPPSRCHLDTNDSVWALRLEFGVLPSAKVPTNDVC